MSKVYESLKEVVHETLQRNKNNSIPLARTKHTDASSLSEEIDEIEKAIVGKMGGLKAIAKQREDVITKQTRQAESVIETLRENIATVETRLKEAEDTIRRKESAIQKMEESQTAKIHSLEDALKKNKETLQSRDAEINDLKSQVQLLTRGVMEMSSFFKQAEALAAVDKQNGGTVVVSEPMNGVQEKPADTELKGPAVTSNRTHAAQQTVPPDFFDRVTHELTQIMGPMAPIIIRDKVASLGESMEKFPNSRVREIIEVLSKQILNENLKTRFRVCFAKHL
jgi:hypothetical protein